MSNYNSTSEQPVRQNSQNSHNDHLHKQVPIRRVSPVPIDSSEVPSSGSEELESQPLLDPDDPMVSPLNLRKIQNMKTAVRVLVYLNLILLGLLIISEFFAIPWFTNKGKSFLEIDLVIICLVINSINNLFFIIPAYYERIIGYVISGMLAIDLFVILCVSSVRTRFGLLGTLLILWTCLNSFLNSIIDYYVEEARHSQEIRYTGRIEKRRTVSELLIMTIKVLVELFLLWLIWCISVSLLLQSFDAHEKPWGKLIPVNNSQHRIHLACFGDVYDNNSTDPIVLVEGGQRTSSEEFQEWIEELYHLNKLDRYCIWDRPGYGFSDSAPPPVSLGIITEYLTEALEQENIQGPFSIVAFDIGGLYAELFASKNKAKIHSILFVDSWSKDLLRKWPFSGENKKNEDPKVFKGSLQLMDNITGFRLWLRGFISPLGLITNIHWFFHPMKYSSKSRIFGRDMIYQSKYLRTRCQEQLTSSILSYNEVVNINISDIPISVISSDYMIKKSLNWGKWQREITRLSNKLNEWVIAENSDHFIWKSAKGRKELQQLLLRLIGKQSYQET
ncbi:putative vacuolar membrane protein [Spathaspora sp. JA1]|nr:putative vacuolar membrane protein [Spathaspora sp. JA1]